MFEAEADGLRELGAANALRVPFPVCYGAKDDYAWLVLENLGELDTGVAADWAALGRGLALMHRCRRQCYGWQWRGQEQRQP